MPVRFANATAQQMLLANGLRQDPYFSSVVLLMHADGTNGGTTFTDSSSLAHSLTVSPAGPTTSTTKILTGTASHRGAAAGNIALPTSTAWQFGTGDFTIEWFGYAGNTGVLFAWCPQSTSAPFGFSLQLNGSSTGYIIYDKWATNYRTFSGGSENAGDWTHYSLNRVSGAWVGTMNGAVLSQANAAGDGVPATRDFTVNVGRMGSVYKDSDLGGSGLSGPGGNGFIDEYRITKGVARYTGAHSIPGIPFPNS